MWTLIFEIIAMSVIGAALVPVTMFGLSLVGLFPRIWHRA